LERQESIVKKTSDLLGAPILKQWSVDQSSKEGKNLARKDLREAYDFCKVNRSVKYVLVDDVDRFMRSIKEFYWYEVEFERIGVLVYYCSTPELNENTMTAKVTKLLKILQAEMSNNERIIKSTSGLKARVKNGYYPFPIPQGYRRTMTPGLYEPDPERFKLLQTSFREILAGLTPAEALRRLNNRGYKTPTGKEMQLARFMKILRCPYYAGLLRIEGWDFVNDHGLQNKMISKDEFEELQNRLSGKKLRDRRRQHNPDFPLSSMITCTQCGAKLVGCVHRNGKGGEWDKYRCRGCNKEYHKKDVHLAIDDVLKASEISSLNGDILIKKLEQIWKEEQSENVGYREILSRRLNDLHDKKNKLLLSMAQNPELKDDFLQTISMMKYEIAEVEQQIRDSKKIDDDLVEFISFSVGFLERQAENWWNLSYEDMERCKDLLYPAGFSIDYNKKVYTPEISPILCLKSNKKELDLNSNSLLVEVPRVALGSKRLKTYILQV